MTNLRVVVLLESIMLAFASCGGDSPEVCYVHTCEGAIEVQCPPDGTWATPAPKGSR